MLTKIITLVITGRKQEKDIDKDNDIDIRVIKNNSLRGLDNLVARMDLVDGSIHWNSGFVK